MTVLSDTTSSSRPNDPASILAHFAALPEPRRPQGRIHELDESGFLSLCVVRCGVHSWPQIADDAASKRDWLKTFLILRQGLPSHDPFRRGFCWLDPLAFLKCCSDGMTTLRNRQDRKCCRHGGRL